MNLNTIRQKNNNLNILFQSTEQEQVVTQYFFLITSYVIHIISHPFYAA